MWFVFALLSAIFAALTSILAKIGIEGVNSHLATAIRTVVVVVMSWGMVFLTHAQSGIGGISKKSWLFLILSGIATGVSWLCYYKALQMGSSYELPTTFYSCFNAIASIVSLILSYETAVYPRLLILLREIVLLSPHFSLITVVGTI